MKEIRKELLDELLEDYEGPEDLVGDAGLLESLQKALMERVFGAELTEHLGYEKGDPVGRGSGNNRNGHSKKRILTDSGSVEVSVPRDRKASFEPQLVKKGQSRLPGFDEKVISLYARGMTQREIRGHLEELYGIAVSVDLISRVTDEVLDEVKAWQTRPLDPIYAVIFFDALFVKIRDEGTVRNKAVYLAIGIALDGTKEILGLWIEQTERAKFWLRVMNELRTRGHWKTLTFIAGLRHDRLTAPWVIDGAMDGLAIVAYITTQLAPTLQSGDVVVMDNLPAHKVAAASKAIKKRGAWPLFLPAYSPDLNPIELAFSKLKAHLKRMAPRTLDELWKSTGEICDFFTQQECTNFFKANGYVPR